MWIAPYTRDAACKRWAQAECGLRSEKHDKIQDVDCEGLTLNPELRTPNSNGFTLIEVIIVIVIISIIGSIAAMIILQGAKSYSIEDFRSNAHYQAKLAVERMAREIRLIRSQTAADITAMAANTIRYTDIQGTQMGFRLTGTTIERTQDNAATWQPLATGATALTFTYLQSDGVTPTAAATTLWYVVIDITEQPGTETLNMRTRVHPRNF